MTTVSAAGWDPDGAYRVSLTGGRVLWVEWQAALHAQTPGLGRLADNTQLARWASQGEARHYSLPKTRWVQWPAAACLPAHLADTANGHLHSCHFFSDRAQLGSLRLCNNGLFSDGLSGFFACEVSDFAVQSRPQQEAERPIWKTFTPQAAYDWYPNRHSARVRRNLSMMAWSW